MSDASKTLLQADRSIFFCVQLYTRKRFTVHMFTEHLHSIPCEAARSCENVAAFQTYGQSFFFLTAHSLFLLRLIERSHTFNSVSENATHTYLPPISIEDSHACKLDLLAYYQYRNSWRNMKMYHVHL